MRIWSMHPKYLDTKGLVALWRETLLAKNVLEGNTKGYKNHPQLHRFKTAMKPMEAINFYLKIVWLEARKRNYNFDESKFESINDIEPIDLTLGQLLYERQHLLNKLRLRDEKKCFEILKINTLDAHPLFNLIKGEIEVWEKI